MWCIVGGVELPLHIFTCLSNAMIYKIFMKSSPNPELADLNT